MKLPTKESTSTFFKSLAGIIALIVALNTVTGAVVFYYLDARYLQLLEIAAKLDPIYVSIDSYKEQQKAEEIRVLGDKIFMLTFQKSKLESEGKILSPFDATLLLRYESQLLTIRARN